MLRAAGIAAVVVGSVAVLSCARPPVRGMEPANSEYLVCPGFHAPDPGRSFTLTDQGGTFTSGDVTLVLPGNTVAATTTVRMTQPASPKNAAGATFDEDVAFLPGETATLRIALDHCPHGQLQKIWLWNVDSLTSPLPREIEGDTIVSTLHHLSTYILASSQ